MFCIRLACYFSHLNSIFYDVSRERERGRYRFVYIVTIFPVYIFGRNLWCITISSRMFWRSLFNTQTHVFFSSLFLGFAPAVNVRKNGKIRTSHITTQFQIPIEWNWFKSGFELEKFIFKLNAVAAAANEIKTNLSLAKKIAYTSGNYKCSGMNFHRHAASVFDLGVFLLLQHVSQAKHVSEASEKIPTIEFPIEITCIDLAYCCL